VECVAPQEEKEEEKGVFSMRTLILTLTVMLLAAPVWATVTITTSIDPENDKKVLIGYTSDEGRVRAFALDIVATGGDITDIGDFAVGDDNGGYGIFPGSFDDNIVVDAETGEVVTWAVEAYTPVAPGDDPGALGDIIGPEITIELGSLYPEGGNAPSATEGTLCSITVDENVTEVCITANAIRGNVVMEDANEPDTLVVDCQPIGADCTSALRFAEGDMAGSPLPPGPPFWGNDGKPDGAVGSWDLQLVVENWEKTTATGMALCADCAGSPLPPGPPFWGSNGLPDGKCTSWDLQKLVENWGT
jgi:hypothetical protein